jgi:hypothetical protein
VTDWPAWHRQYDDADSSLARRLAVVRRRIGEALTADRAGPDYRILSLCAGDGRDLLPELGSHPGCWSTAVLVEKDQKLVAAGQARSSELGLDMVEVVVGDAGDTATFAAHLPVDLLLLCGIFGNVSDEDIRTTVAATPSMLRPDGRVIWTRGRSDPDLRPVIRRWFVEAGLDEDVFDGEPESFGVGVGHLVRPPPKASSHPARLFTFQQ